MVHPVRATIIMQECNYYVRTFTAAHSNSHQQQPSNFLPLSPARAREARSLMAVVERLGQASASCSAACPFYSHPKDVPITLACSYDYVDCPLTCLPCPCPCPCPCLQAKELGFGGNDEEAGTTGTTINFDDDSDIRPSTGQTQAAQQAQAQANAAVSAQVGRGGDARGGKVEVPQQVGRRGEGEGGTAGTGTGTCALACGQLWERRGRG